MPKNVYIARKTCSGKKICSSMHRNFEVWIFLLQVPNVKWEDVGGLEDVKKSILDTVQVSFLYDITISFITLSPDLKVQFHPFRGQFG